MRRYDTTPVSIFDFGPRTRRAFVARSTIRWYVIERGARQSERDNERLGRDGAGSEVRAALASDVQITEVGAMKPSDIPPMVEREVWVCASCGRPFTNRRDYNNHIPTCRQKGR